MPALPREISCGRRDQYGDGVREVQPAVEVELVIERPLCAGAWFSASGLPMLSLVAHPDKAAAVRVGEKSGVRDPRLVSPCSVSQKRSWATMMSGALTVWRKLHVNNSKPSLIA
mmetsp:Transcript_32343/g.59580  ORF Transcript_32343/g.59580 Transcript_32343/m.59580 type:complete len:114 (+) Transcript_32343:578-919(+)